MKNKIVIILILFLKSFLADAQHDCSCSSGGFGCDCACCETCHYEFSTKKVGEQCFICIKGEDCLESDNTAPKGIEIRNIQTGVTGSFGALNFDSGNEICNILPAPGIYEFTLKANCCNPFTQIVRYMQQEQCNGWDDNCDLVIDNVSDSKKTTFYRDRDEDGYGSINDSIRKCFAPDGYVQNSSDCDDNCQSCHPGGEEICGDGKDNNCDGRIDENIKTYYIDKDGDGIGTDVRQPCHRKMLGNHLTIHEKGKYIDLALTIDSCSKPSGYSQVKGDCDDCDASVHPSKKLHDTDFFHLNREICDNKDNDCDGEIDEELDRKYYPDADKDGKGDIHSQATIIACNGKPPKGYVSNNLDKHDNPGASSEREEDEDLINLNNNISSDNAFIIVDGNFENVNIAGGCVNDKIFRGTHEIPIDNVKLSNTCNSETIVISKDNALFIESTNRIWTNERGDIENINLLPLIKVPIVIWKEPHIDANPDVLMFTASKIFNQINYAGISLEYETREQLSELKSLKLNNNLLTGACDVQKLIDIGCYEANHINIYFLNVDPIIGGTSVGGLECTNEYSIIYIPKTTGKTALAHELGHSFSLPHIEVPNNLMLLESTEAEFHSKLTLGQIYRMHINASSAINKLLLRNNQIIRNCTESSLSGDCPSILLDY